MDNFFLLTVSAWFMLVFLQGIGWPLIAHLTRKQLVDRGWAPTRVVVWLALGLFVWFTAHFRLPANTTGFVWILLAAGLIGSGVVFYRHYPELTDAFKTARKYIFIEELLFALGFFGLSYIRAHNPHILDLEKFMDAGFMNSYLRSPTLPAPDMWLAGDTINYYSFGHFMGSLMSRIWLTPVRYSYNLLLGLIMGFSFILSFSVVVNLLAPIRKQFASAFPLYVGGLIGSFLVTVGGNTHTIWYLLKHGSSQGYWYADATRFIDRTIHEFPSYSFVVSDLHAHVWGLPLVLTFLILVPVWLRALLAGRSRQTYAWAVVMGVFLGTFMMTSAWDLMIYGLLLAVAGAVLFFRQPAALVPLLISAVLVGATAGVVVAPWLVNFTNISGGPRIATEHSPFWQLLVLWTGHVALSALAAGIAVYLLRRRPKPLSRLYDYPVITILAFALTAWLLLLLPELIFLKDIYTGHPRANTMFKLTYQAFILMSLCGGWGMGLVAAKGLIKNLVRWPLVGVCAAIFLAVGIFPYFAYRDYYGALQTYKSLDGWTWLQEQYPHDFQAVTWLAQNVTGQPHILEAWGESYTTFDRASALTGLPTVIGWRVHEWLWRGGFDVAGKRSGEVDEIYKRPLSPEAQNYLNQYRVEYIIVGEKEREAYPNDLNLTDLGKLGPTVFSSGPTQIIKYSPKPASNI